MISFYVVGKPKSQGSKKAFVVKGRAVMAEMVNNKTWRKAVHEAAKQQMDGDLPLRQPVVVGLTFYFRRPKAHYIGQSGVLRAEAPTFYPSKPDADKLARCVLDALTGACIVDDSQVVILSVTKTYLPEVLQADGQEGGVQVSVSRA